MKSHWQEGVIECPEFDLTMTLESGQSFHWIQQEGGYAGCVGRTPYFVRQEGNLLHYRSIGSDDHEKILSHYFAFDHDLTVIRESCAGHLVSHKAALACRGLRIMRQPHWECIASFILSPMKQVAHIRQMSHALRVAYGTKLHGSPVPAFPAPEILASTSEEGLRQCGLGFRAKGLLGTAKLIASGAFDPVALVTMKTDEARTALCTLPGIGRKVANCILLFSYERLNAVPVDVWIARILGSFRSRKETPQQLERYGERLLGPYAGYIQQYLFHQARTGKLVIPQKLTRKNPSKNPSSNQKNNRSRRLVAA
jgi:N-glycosylase/DNA lyase